MTTISRDRYAALYGPTRALGKADMPQNTACPEIRVEPDTFRVWVDGEEIEPQPVDELPLAQRYELFYVTESEG